MLPSFSTWWRALCVVLLSLATLAWPQAATASTSRPAVLVHQDDVATLHHGVATIALTLHVGGENDDGTTVNVALYGRLTARSQLTSIFDQQSSPTTALDATGPLALDCRSKGVASFRVGLGQNSLPSSNTNCTGMSAAALDLHCSANCDGVYPLKITVSTQERTTRIWTVVAVSSAPVPTPLHLVWLMRSSPLSEKNLQNEFQVLAALLQRQRIPVALSVSYVGANYLQWNTSAYAQGLRTSITKLLSTPNSSLVTSPPGNIDYAGLSANGLASEVAEQLKASSSIMDVKPSSFVALNGPTSLADLSALSAAGAKNVVIPEDDLRTPPSQTLTWGAPFRVSTASPTLLATTDQPLSALSMNTSLSPGLASALFMGTLAFLHFEAPYAANVRTVIVPSSLNVLRSSFVSDIEGALRTNPFVKAAGLSSVFSSSLVGTNGAPSVQTLSSSPSSSWSQNNYLNVLRLTYNTTSFSQATASPQPVDALLVARLSSEIVTNPAERQYLIDQAATVLSNQLTQFKVNEGSITLAGSGTSLPITLTSSANYAVTGVIKLVASHLHAPKKNLVISLSPPTKSLRVPANIIGGGSFTLQVLFTTPDGKLILAKGAIQVRNAPTSIVGYALSIGSLFVIALWWWRTHRRTSKGRHAK